jgi:hypothetical protein
LTPTWNLTHSLDWKSIVPKEFEAALLLYRACILLVESVRHTRSATGRPSALASRKTLAALSHFGVCIEFLSKTIFSYPALIASDVKDSMWLQHTSATVTSPDSFCCPYATEHSVVAPSPAALGQVGGVHAVAAASSARGIA